MEVEMQVWEYRWAIFPYGLGKMKTVIEESGKSVKVEVIDYVNELGRLGWKMVGIWN